MPGPEFPETDLGSEWLGALRALTYSRALFALVVRVFVFAFAFVVVGRECIPWPRKRKVLIDDVTVPMRSWQPLRPKFAELGTVGVR